MQQSAAFKILRTRLKTVPTYSFSGGGNQISRASSGVPFSQYMNHHEDDDAEDINITSSHQGINFAARLQQFENVQSQHRVQARNNVKYTYTTSSSSASKVKTAQPIFDHRMISQFNSSFLYKLHNFAKSSSMFCGKMRNKRNYVAVVRFCL